MHFLSLPVLIWTFPVTPAPLAAILHWRAHFPVAVLLIALGNYILYLMQRTYGPTILRQSYDFKRVYDSNRICGDSYDKGNKVYDKGNKVYKNKLLI